MINDVQSPYFFLIHGEHDLGKGIEFRHWSGKMISFLSKQVREIQGNSGKMEMKICMNPDVLTSLK